MSNRPNEQDLQQTLMRLAKPRMSPERLFKEMKRLHPEASKKEIIHAAFASIIAVVDSDVEKALVLQDFAIKGRGPENGD